VLPANGTLFRYGSTEEQALGSTGDWVNLSEDRYQTSQEVIERLCLLDMTAPGAKEWNTAGWRAMFVAKIAIPVWYGQAGPMAFDVFSGKRYRGPGDLSANMTRGGGGSQVLVHKSNFPGLFPSPPVSLPGSLSPH
jgi:hypothetical protein